MDVLSPPSPASTGWAVFLPNMRDSNVAILDSPLHCGTLRVRDPDRHDVARQPMAPDVDVVARAGPAELVCFHEPCLSGPLSLGRDEGPFPAQGGPQRVPGERGTLDPGGEGRHAGKDRQLAKVGVLRGGLRLAGHEAMELREE